MLIDFSKVPLAERKMWFQVLTALQQERMAAEQPEGGSLYSWVKERYSIQMLCHDPINKPEVAWGMELSEQTATYLLLKTGDTTGHVYLI